MRRAAKVDRNQRAVVDAFRKLGCSVQQLHMVGSGCPDLLVGTQVAGGKRVNLLVEVKDGKRPPSERKLNPIQEMWHRNWRGVVRVVTSPEEATKLICEERGWGGIVYPLLSESALPGGDE